MHSLAVLATERLSDLEERQLLRRLQNSNPADAVTVMRKGKKLVSFCSNDYLGLSYHPQVIEVAIEATQKYGIGAGASRLVTGNHLLYDELEKLLAEVKGTEAACVFGSGYLANIGIIPALMGRGDLIIADKYSHSCMIAGAKLSDAVLKRYSHNSIDSLVNILKKNRNSYNNCLILTETIFSMGGDAAPVAEIAETARKYDAWLMTDDAHGLGVAEPQTQTDIQMGTLSKAVGSYGGYVCASREVIDYIKTTAASLIYSTALPPGVVAASIAALGIIREDKTLCAMPLKKAQLFTSLLDLEPAQSAIVPLVLGNEERALHASETLEQQGFLVTAIRPPTVPKGTARLRFTFSAMHQDADIERLAEIVKQQDLINV